MNGYDAWKLATPPWYEESDPEPEEEPEPAEEDARAEAESLQREAAL